MTGTPPAAPAPPAGAVPAGVVALRIRFRPGADAAGERVVTRFTDPHAALATASNLDPAALPAPVADPRRESVDDLVVVFVPGGSAGFAFVKAAEAFMVRPADPDAEPTIELVLRSDRVLWRPGRAAIIGAADRFDETLAGLVDWAFHEGELRRLERECDDDWHHFEADVPLVHQVSGGDLLRRPHVNAMTAAVTRRRMRYARLERRLEKANIALPGPARRMVAEFAVQAEVLDRMKSVDDRLEVYEDLYELANDRLSEYSYFIREYRLEFAIMLILGAEVALMAVELWYEHQMLFSP
jgi:hypothetical protein